VLSAKLARSSAPAKSVAALLGSNAWHLTCKCLASLMSELPATIWLVRHGESAGNVAHSAAERSGASTISIDGRDVDVPLSPLGERQARALGDWFHEQPEGKQPTVILSSPYVRARQTSELILERAGIAHPLFAATDERLREKEFGTLNRFTRAGILATFPEEARRRTEIGKFYYRPPGGESWCDVILRLRSVVDQLQLRHAGQRVLIVAHQVIVLCFRYLLEDLDEQRLLDIDRSGDVANCSLTSYELSSKDGAESLQLRAYNFLAPLEQAGAPVTAEPDAAATK